MNTKLTLRLDDSLIHQAKKYARTEGKSISQIVAAYFKAIQTGPAPKKHKVGPITSKLRGCLKGERVTEEDYKKHLEKKFL
jgi:hypothetical protein